MNIKKSLLAAGAVATVGLAGVTGVGVVSAATDPNATGSLVDKIAAKFKLNKADVQAVFDANRTQRETDRLQKFDERLDQAVTEGKLTSDQKDKIVAKQKEMAAQRSAFIGKTKDQIKALADTRRAQLAQWAKDNNIPAEFIKFGMGGPRGEPMGEPKQ